MWRGLDENLVPGKSKSSPVDPAANQIYNMTVDEARARVLNGSPEAVREIEGSFALVAREGKRVRLARSMDRPLRYFLAKRAEGPATLMVPMGNCPAKPTGAAMALRPAV